MSVRTSRGELRVVEVIGLTGTGKTTVIEAIASRDGIAVRSRYRAAANVPAYLGAAVRLAPMLVAAPRSWRDRNRMIRTESTWAIARRAVRGRLDAIVFDQGPLFLLNQLSDAPGMEAWRVSRLRRWAGTLDGVVFLDAPDDVLVRRIRHRTKEHTLRGVPDDVAVQALDADRRSFDRLLTELDRVGPVPVRRLDTSTSPIETTVALTMRTIAALPVP